MGIKIAENVRAIQHSNNISESLVLKMIEETLLAAYKKRYGSNDNAVVNFSDDNSYVFLYAKKTIVEDDDWDNPILHIEISEAKTYNEEAEVGDEILIEIDTTTFDRSDIQTAKQKAKGDLKEIKQDVRYSEFKDRKGEIIIGYFRREHNGNYFFDLGSGDGVNADGRSGTEGMMPKRFQSNRETFSIGERVKVLVWDVTKTPQGVLSIVLSRTHAEFVEKLLEKEVTEIGDGTVVIEKIVREPGYRTKLAVSAYGGDIDPVGACVGPKGIRIQNIVRELEGEKIDVLRYSTHYEEFIANALSPAEVQQVIILDIEKKQALAVVDEQQFSLAIGKQGLNVRLANRLVDWSIDVKTRSQFEKMDVVITPPRSADALFDNSDESEITSVTELPGLSDRLIEILRENGIELIESLLNLTRNDLMALKGLIESDVEAIMKVINENVSVTYNDEIAVSGDSEDNNEVFEYICPECEHPIKEGMTKCPNCGVELEFEEEAD